MTTFPAVPACPLCGDTSWRRERFFALEAARPTAQVVVFARCRGCGLGRYFRPEGESSPFDPGLEGAEDPVRFLRNAVGSELMLEVAHGARWRRAPVPAGRRWLFDRATLRRALGAAGWRAVALRGFPWSPGLRATARR